MAYDKLFTVSVSHDIGTELLIGGTELYLKSLTWHVSFQVAFMNIDTKYYFYNGNQVSIINHPVGDNNLKAGFVQVVNSVGEREFKLIYQDLTKISRLD